MDERSERIARILDPIVTVAALAVIPVIVVQESDLGAGWKTLADVVDWLSWSAFVAEVAIMLAVVPDRARWLRHHMLEVAIVVLTPPFVAIFQSARLLRLLRLVWLLRLYPVAHRLFTAAGVKSAALLVALIAVAGGAAFAELERGQTTANGIYGRSRR